jgi:hypothetical protein
MVPVDSIQVSRDWTYSGASTVCKCFRVRDCHPVLRNFPESSTNFTQSDIEVLQPREGNPLGLGSSDFARRY